MAAGLGFKTFNTGEVLTSADVNGYLMQGVLVFASEAARDAAITSPQEGQFAYTKDNNSLWYYTGSAWAASGATGDIEGVTAGTGISGGGTSGTVTITNSMATAIDAKGDLVVGTGADTFARLAVGTNGHTLVADSVETTGLKWVAPASGGGMTLLSTTTLSGASTTISSIDQTYVNLQIFITGMTNATSAATPDIQFNGSGSNFTGVELYNSNTTAGTGALTSTSFKFITAPTRTDANNFWGITIFNYASTTAYKGAFSVMGATRNAGGEASGSNFGYIKTNSAISSLVITNPGGNWSTGTVLIYGVK